jgi:hypothetical protein
MTPGGEPAGCPDAVERIPLMMTRMALVLKAFIVRPD